MLFINPFTPNFLKALSLSDQIFGNISDSLFVGVLSILGKKEVYYLLT